MTIQGDSYQGKFLPIFSLVHQLLRNHIALLIFFGAAFLLWLMGANRLSLINDEGIYLYGAVLILRGQAPYSDFFVLTGPGTFWLLAAVFRFLGTKLSFARLLPILDIAFLTMMVYWLTARFSRPGFGMFLAFVYFSFQVIVPDLIVVNHRWDSAAFAMAALSLFLSGVHSGKRPLFFVAGMFAAGAVWITPSLITAPIALVVWLIWNADLRKQVVTFLLGVSLSSMAAVFFLSLHGALGSMFGHFLWTASNYASANRFFYGGVIGGYGAIFSNAGGAEILSVALVAFAVALPAILPIAAYLGVLFKILKSREEILLVIFSIAMLASTYPRMDVGHLQFITPIFYVLAGCMAERALTGAWRRFVSLCFAVIATMFLTISLTSITDGHSVETRIGKVHGKSEELILIEKLSQNIPAGESVFVFPYMPFFYFLTNAENPTRYSFLQPGMMTLADEQAVLSQLKLHPAKLVIYFDVPPEAYLRLWPSSDPDRLRMNSIERWLRSKYCLTEAISYREREFQILRLISNQHGNREVFGSFKNCQDSDQSNVNMNGLNGGSDK